jgi:hypothetical protein
MTSLDDPPAGPRRRLLIWAGTITATALLGAAAMVIWAPWHTPTPPMAISLPATCPTLLGLPAPRQSAGSARKIDCSWGTPVDDGFPPVQASTTLYPTIYAAQHASATQMTTFDGPTHGYSLGADTPIAGVGDEARITDHDNLIILVARKANVVLTLRYLAPADVSPDQNQAVLATAARTILGGVTLTTTAA